MKDVNTIDKDATGPIQRPKLGEGLCSDKNLVLNLNQDKDPSINKNLVCEKSGISCQQRRIL